MPRGSPALQGPSFVRNEAPSQRSLLSSPMRSRRYISRNKRSVFHSWPRYCDLSSSLTSYRGRATSAGESCTVVCLMVVGEADCRKGAASGDLFSSFQVSSTS